MRTIGSILPPTKIADFFHRLCGATTEVIFFMCTDAILGCDIFEKKKRSIRCDCHPCSQHMVYDYIEYHTDQFLFTCVARKLPPHCMKQQICSLAYH